MTTNPTLALPPITPTNATQLSARYIFKQGWMSNLAWSADGNFLAVATAEGVALYAMSNLNHPQLLSGHAEPIRAVCFAGNWCYSAGDEGRIWRWNLDDLSGMPIFTLHRSLVSCLASYPDGTIASGGREKLIHLWNSETGELYRTLTGHEGEITNLAFSPDGQQFASASWDTTVRIWDIATGEVIHTLQAHGDRVNQALFHPNALLLATSGRDGTVKVWSVEDWSLRFILEDHAAPVDRLAFSPDGSILASGGRDNTVRLWNIKDGTPLATLSGHQKPVMALGFNPQGTVLASAGGEHVGVLWGVKP